MANKHMKKILDSLTGYQSKTYPKQQNHFITLQAAVTKRQKLKYL